MSDATILSDFLAQLGVRHTVKYSDLNYRKMSFQSLFGFTKLLERYGIDSKGVKLDNKDEFAALPLPFLAQTPKGFLIVTGVSADGSRVTYLSEGVSEQADAKRFKEAWTGVALLAAARTDAAEPDYGRHLLEVRGDRIKQWLLPLCAAVLFLWLFIGGGLWHHASLWFLALFNLGGLYFTTLLVKKSAHLTSRHADAVCGVIQAGGCDDILALPAAKFFGLFGWSEVGLAYFSVSLGVMLLFPAHIPQLALINACCLPFTLWSIWYQKFRARHWCTLCVCVQATLWALFFSYLGGGWFSRGAWPPAGSTVIIALAYLTALLFLNRIMPLIEKTEPDETL